MSEPRDSFGRCIIYPSFLDRFYEIFLASHPAVKPHFKNTNFVRQKDLLRTGLSMMLMFEDEKPVAKLALNRIGKSHGKEGLNIDRGLYQCWLDSLVAAVKEYDSQFSPEVERRWRVAMQKGIDCILAQG